MDLGITLKKEDFKRFKKCFKIAWTLALRSNLKTVQEWVTAQKISVFFDLQDNINSAKIDEAIFIDDYENEGGKGLFQPHLYDLALETYWPADENANSNDVRTLPDDVQTTMVDVKIDFYPGETIADGNEVGQRAREYFMRDHNYFNLEHYSKKIAFAKTTEVLANPNYDVYFEPSFVYNNCITKCDILKKFPDGTYHLIEVKASTGRKYDKETQMYVDKNVKDEYGYDVAYQYYVLTGTGLTISRVSLMLLNSEYQRIDDIDDEQLFMFQDLYKLPTKILPVVSLLEFCQQMMTGQFVKRVEKNHIITDDLALIKHYFMQPVETIFSLFSKEQCLNGKGDRYGYCQHVTSYLPPHHSVFELTHGMEKKTLLKYQEHIYLLKDIVLPFTFKQLTRQKKPILFSEKQQRQILAVQDNAPVVNPKKVAIINQILGKYQYPIYMYDFETMKAAVPRFDYSYSYQQIPFQYSVHIIKDNHFDYQDKTTMEHHAFLADGDGDPRLALIKHLVTDLFSRGGGVYVAYYKSFECKVLAELISYLTILINQSRDEKFITTYQDWQKKISIIRNKTIDLMDFFQDFMIYKKEFYGSASIKKTQPTFDNQFTYQALKVKKGDVASEIFRRRVENNIPVTIWQKSFRAEMLKYCNRDTLAMVIIYQHIVRLMGSLTPIKVGKNMQKKYRVIFMGTPIFATAVLKALQKLAPTIEIIGIVTQPDRKIRRQQLVQFSPVKEFALTNQIPVFQPEKINDLYTELGTLQPDVIVTCAYGQFIPERILKLARINCINVHASLLPKLRGGAPIHKAIIYGEQETGITLMKMIKKMDAGEIYVQVAIPISPTETTSSLYDRLMVLVGTMIEKHLLDIITGKIKGIPQDDSQATFAYNITRDEEKVNWFLPKQKIVDQIRGLYAWPIAYTTVNNIHYKLHQAMITLEPLAEKDADFVNGTIIDISKLGIKVKVEDGYLLITRLQREGKKVTDAKNYYHNASSEIMVGNIFI